MPKLSLALRCLPHLAAWFCLAPQLFAHDPGLSSMDATVSPGGIQVTVTLNARDWESTGITTADGIRKECVAVRVDGIPMTPETTTGPIPDHIQNVSCLLTYPQPAPGRLVIESLILDKLPFGHREFVKIHDPSGNLLAEQMLDAGHASCSAILKPDPRTAPARAASGAFSGFLLLGVRHILTGYDHMLFLAGLLLVCRSFREAARVITYFTIAHSVTLALSVLNVISLPGRAVEPAVAASIVYVGIENIFRPQDLKWRGPVAFGFGLIHGLGFAGVLRGIGIGSGHTGILLPLVTFNLGVELGQLAVALTLLPIIFLLRERPIFCRFGTPAVSTGIASLGALWFLQRMVFAW